MRFITMFLLLAGVAWAIAQVFADDPPAKSDLDRLQGEWVLYGLIFDNEPAPADIEESFIRISGNQVRTITKDKQKKESPSGISFTIDPKRTPKTVDLHWLENNKKVVWKGIYTFKDDKVRIALAVKSKPLFSNKPWERADERPSAFNASGRPKDCFVLVLVLIRPKVVAAAKKAEESPPPQSIAYNGFSAVAISPDGKWVAASGRPGTTVWVWEVATGKEIARLAGHDSEVRSAVAGPDGKRLYAATTTEVRVWEVPPVSNSSAFPLRTIFISGG